MSRGSAASGAVLNSEGVLSLARAFWCGGRASGDRDAVPTRSRSPRASGSMPVGRVWRPGLLICWFYWAAS